MRRLTKKQAAIARERVKNPEATQTEIGSKVGVRRQRVQKFLAQPHVQESIREALEKEPRLRVKALARKIADKTTAKSVKVFQTKDGEIIYSEPLEDHSIQLRAVELTLELKGNLKKSVELTGKDGEPLVPETNAIKSLTRDELLSLIEATNPKPRETPQAPSQHSTPPA